MQVFHLRSLAVHEDALDMPVPGGGALVVDVLPEPHDVRLLSQPGASASTKMAEGEGVQRMQFPAKTAGRAAME
jgi:hypothetical protein